MAFIVFEGLDGSGKSTLIRRLERELHRRGVRFVSTREPGGTPLAERMRELLLRHDGDTPSARTELLLYAAARAQHVDCVIAPAIARGEWVVCDRFVASTVAFQCYGRSLSRRDVDSVNAFAVQETLPNLTVLLDLPIAESVQRREARGVANGELADRLESESLAFHERVRQGYLRQAEAAVQLSGDSWLVLDARLAPEALYEALTKCLQQTGHLE